jgi:hypothetical protein
MDPGSGQHVKKLFVNLGPEQVDHSPVLLRRGSHSPGRRGGHSLGYQQGTNLQLAGSKIVRLNANHAGRLGAQLSQEIAHENLFVARVQGRAGREPPLLGAAEEIWPGSVGEQKDHDVDEGRQSDGEPVAKRGRSEQFLERDQQIILLACRPST